MKMSAEERTIDRGCGDDSLTEGKKYPDYCRTITFTDNNGVIRELVFPKALDLDRPKRARTTFSRDQLDRLEAEFSANQYMVGKERSQLARTLGLSETQVKVWFQNRRTKHKRDKDKLDETREAKAETMATKNLFQILQPSGNSTPTQVFSETSSQAQLSYARKNVIQHSLEPSNRADSYMPKPSCPVKSPLHKDCASFREASVLNPASDITLPPYQSSVCPLPSSLRSLSSIAIPPVSSPILGVGAGFGRAGLSGSFDRSHRQCAAPFGVSAGHGRVHETWFSDPYTACQSSFVGPTSAVHLPFPAAWSMYPQSLP